MKLLSEEIAEPEQLWQELSLFGENLVSVIPKMHESSPMLLSGDWGSGKSSVLEYLQREATSKEHKVILFEAWKYEQEDSLLPNLVRKVWQEGQTKEHHCMEIVLAAATVLTQKLSPLVLNEVESFFGIPNVFSKLSKVVNKIKGVVKKNNVPPVAASLCDVLCDKFYQAIRKLYPEQSVTILIDDLDRCSPASSLQLLDNIRMIINGLLHHQKDKEYKVRFLVAMDQVTVTEIVANKFKGLDHYEANRYLEKLFPCVFRLPTMSAPNLTVFVEKHIEMIEQGEEFGYLSKCEEIIIENLQEKAFCNPRLIKRCLNKFALFFYFSKPDFTSLEPTKYAALFLWVPATERWPQLRRLLVRKPFSFWKSVEKKLTNTEKFEGVPFDDKEADQLIVQKGFKEFFVAHLAYDLKDAIEKYQEAEKDLSEIGL